MNLLAGDSQPITSFAVLKDDEVIVRYPNADFFGTVVFSDEFDEYYSVEGGRILRIGFPDFSFIEEIQFEADYTEEYASLLGNRYLVIDACDQLLAVDLETHDCDALQLHQDWERSVGSGLFLANQQRLVVATNSPNQSTLTNYSLPIAGLERPAR